MKRHFTYLILASVIFLLLPNAVFAQEVCNCNPIELTDLQKQHRSGAKHVTDYASFPISPDTIYPETIYKWQSKYKSLTKTIKTNPSDPASHRKNGTPEDSMYILKGYMYFVKQERNDCDFHMEIGPKKKSKTRIVVEVASENCLLQRKIYNYITSHGYHVVNIDATSAPANHFPVGLPCVVKGLGFYDASHKPNTNHGDKHTKKYSWELHPVKDIIFLEE